MYNTKIARTTFINWLDLWRDKDVIKVVTGVRRCGKTTLLELYREKLLAQGIPPNRIISINFEDPDTPVFATFQEAWLYLKERMTGDGHTYVFLDEVQIVPEFERFVDGIYSKKICDLYITGSNAKFLSGELATFLTGRYVEIQLHPLSFAEYCTAFPDKHAYELFPTYRRFGGFPMSVAIPQTETAQTDYLSGILNTILFKDLFSRNGIRDQQLLKRLLTFIFDNVGSLLSVNRIAGTFRNDGFMVNNKTLDSYLSMLCDTFLIYRASRYDIRGREILKTNAKYYLADTGFRRILLGDKSRDIGHILENIVFLELKRRYAEVYVGVLGRCEVDFVAVKNRVPTYIQVALTVREEETLKRELAPLKAIRDNNPKILLSFDNDPPANENGIKVLSILDFLLDPKSIETL